METKSSVGRSNSRCCCLDGNDNDIEVNVDVDAKAMGGLLPKAHSSVEESIGDCNRSILYRYVGMFLSTVAVVVCTDDCACDPGLFLSFFGGVKAQCIVSTHPPQTLADKRTNASQIEARSNLSSCADDDHACQQKHDDARFF